MTVTGPGHCTATFVAVYGLAVIVSGPGEVTSSPTGISCGSTCNATYDIGTTVTLTATANTGTRFTGWSGGCSGTNTATTVTMNWALSCTATFVTAYPLTVTVSGQGQVTSSPAGISCGSACSATFDTGTAMTLTPTAADGYRFSGWSGATCPGSSLTMDQARSCTATFTEIVCQRPPDCRASWWNQATCTCDGPPEDPLVFAIDGGAVALTDLAHGVRSDADGDGQAELIAWTVPGSRVGILALDLNGDGLITTGAEIFGQPVTGPIRGRQPMPDENSFVRLAADDRPELGGNGDGTIGPEDAVFSRLRVWVDATHDGVSQPDELIPLAAAGIARIDLTYQLTGGGDGQGNFFRYRGTVHLTNGQSQVIWDVLLKVAQPLGSGSAVARSDGATARAWRVAASPSATADRDAENSCAGVRAPRPSADRPVG